MGTFFNVLSEQNITEHFFGVERSVLTEHLDPVFPRTLEGAVDFWLLPPLGKHLVSVQL